MSTRYTPRRPGAASSSACAACAPPQRLGRRLAGHAAQRPPLLLMHGWMDVGASLQFIVDALAARALRDRARLARLRPAPTHAGADSYWFPDYLGDLDALIDHLSPDAPVDLVGHSMGGNVVMSYAGVRPAAHAPAGQPGRLRHAADQARAGAEAPGAVARRAEDAADAAQLRQPGRGGRAADEDQPAAERGQGRLAGAALVAPAATTGAGTSWAIRRTSASTRC